MVSADAIEVRITDDPDVLAAVASWHWAEWGHQDPGGSLEAWEAGLRERTVFVAISGGEPIGTVVLIEHDMATHPELRPWLGGVFVVPAHRRQRIASELCRVAADAAAADGEVMLYLHTNGAEPLYESLGWVAIAREPYEGEIVTLMRLDLAARAGSGEDSRVEQSSDSSIARRRFDWVMEGFEQSTGSGLARMGAIATDEHFLDARTVVGEALTGYEMRENARELAAQTAAFDASVLESRGELIIGIRILWTFESGFESERFGVYRFDGEGGLCQEVLVDTEAQMLSVLDEVEADSAE